MRALRKGKEMVFEEKSNLLYYIGSIVQTVLGNLKGQNVIVMYRPRKPLMTTVDIYQVRDKHKDQTNLLIFVVHICSWAPFAFHDCCLVESTQWARSAPA